MAIIYVRDTDALPERRDFDFYPTDPITTRAGCHLVHQYAPAARRIVDPGAGLGVWGSECRPLWPKAQILGIDVRELPTPPAYDLWWQGDFLEWTPGALLPDVILGNPPYRHAEAFVRHALAWLPAGGVLLFLLRLTFLESRRRLRLFDQQRPAHVAVLSRRPSFMSDGSRRTSPDAYAFYLWVKGHAGDAALSWIDTGAVPLEQPCLPLS